MEKKKKGGAHLRKSEVKVLPIVIAALAAVVIIGGAAFLAVSAQSCNTVFPNVSACGVPVAGMTRDEARDAISEAITTPLRLSMQTDNGEEIASREIIPAELMGDETAETLADSAYAIGHSNNLFANTFDYIACLMGSKSVGGSDISSAFAEGALSDAVSAITDEIQSEGVNGNYSISGGVLTIIKGAGGISISENSAFNSALAALKAGESTAVLRAQYLPAAEISLSDIYDSVYCEPRSAEFDKDFNILPGEKGLSFDLELARAEYDAAENGSVVAIPLIETEPEYTDEALSELLFRDKLGSWTSKLTSNETRSKNIELAAAEVNGVVVMPGAEFSFNDTVGERTTSRGFGAAPAYIGGQTVDQVGGGICQVSSSIYYCCLYADLEIVYRTCHLYAASYIPLGMDATVSWGGPDFKFRNNMDYPVKIVAWRDGGELFCELYGTKTTDDYIEMTYEVTNTYNYGVTYREDSSVASGQTRTDVSGITGYKVNTYKARYKGDGTLISRELEATSNYSSRNRVILVAPGELYLYDPSVPAPSAEPTSGDGGETPEETPADTPTEPDKPGEGGETEGEAEPTPEPETPETSPEPSTEPIGGGTSSEGDETPPPDASLPESELIEDANEPGAVQ